MKAPAPTPSDGKFCILLIEEDNQVANTVKVALSGAGQEVDWISSSDTGLEEFKQKNHHLVLLDLQLSGKSGRDVCCEIREISAVPVIIITALSGNEDQLLGFRVGADDYLVKPLEPRHLVLRVVALLRRVYRYDRLLPASTSEPHRAQPTQAGQSTQAGTQSTPRASGSLRDALSTQGLAEVPAESGTGLPSGWGGCESCGYMGPHFKFEPEDKSFGASISCPVCTSNQIVFSIG